MTTAPQPCFADFFSNKNMRNLNYVNLSGCKGADDQVKRIIRRSCPRIREIIFEVKGFRKEAAIVDFGIYKGADENSNDDGSDTELDRSKSDLANLLARKSRNPEEAGAAPGRKNFF